MKKIVLFTLLSVAFLAFTGCDDDEGGGNSYLLTEIKVSNITGTGADQIESLALYGGRGGRAVPPNLLADESLVDGAATLRFPASPSSLIMSNIMDDIPDGLDISDEGAMLVQGLHIEAYNGDGDYIGDLYLFKEDASALYEADWMYSDRDFTVRGSGDNGDDEMQTFDLNMKKGWNQIISKYQRGGDIYVSHKTPSGMVWVFERAL